MFAGCIESGSSEIGAKLATLFQSDEGLCGFPFDDRGIYQHRGVTLVQQRLWNTSYSKAEQGVISHANTGVQLLGWLRIDNREELRAKLDFDQPDLALSDAGLVLTAYLKWGSEVAEHLVGDFAIAIWDPAVETCFLVRDQLGVRPLYYFHDKQRGLFLFATSVDIVKDLVGDRLQPSREWISRYILFCSEDWELSAYQGVYKVAPAQVVTFTVAGFSKKSYFQFNAESDLVLSSDQKYVERYRELLIEAIRCRSLTDFPLASELSGGLDSSTVTAIASSCLSDDASDPQACVKQVFYTFGFADREDERDCIDSVAQFAELSEPLLMRYRDATESQIEQYYRRFLAAVGHPLEHPNAVSHIPFYECAQARGVRTLLSGFGGDEFVTSDAQQGLTECWKSRKYGRWLGSFAGTGTASWLRALRWLFYRFRHGGRSSAAVRMRRNGERLLLRSPVKQSLIQQFNLADRVRTHWKYDADIETMNEFTLGDQWSPKLTARLENCTLMAAAHGVEYRWPLLDLRLIRFFLSVPVEQKLSFAKEAGMGRYLHRRACSGLLPEQIVWKNKDMGPVLNEGRETLSSENIEHLSSGSIKPSSSESIEPSSSEAIEPSSSESIEHSPSESMELYAQYQDLAPRLQELVDRDRYQDLLESHSSTAELGPDQLLLLLDALKRLNHWLSAES